MHVASAAHRTAHLLEALDVPDQVVQRVDALLHREGELVVDGAQEVGDLARSDEVGGACSERGAECTAVQTEALTLPARHPTTKSTLTPTPARAHHRLPLMPME